MAGLFLGCFSFSFCQIPISVQKTTSYDFTLDQKVLTGIGVATTESRGICSGLGMESNLGSYKFLLY